MKGAQQHACCDTGEPYYSVYYRLQLSRLTSQALELCGLT